jgi:hypothetical protein
MTAKPRRIPPGSVETYLEAREILALLGPDLEAERHWNEMGREVGVVCRICTEPTAAQSLCQNHYRRHLRASRRNEAARINRANRKAAA